MPSNDEMEMYLMFNGWKVERSDDDWWFPPKGSNTDLKITMTRSLKRAVHYQQIDEGKISERFRYEPRK